MKPLILVIVLVSTIALADETPVLSRDALDIPISPQLMQCQHTEDMITKATLSWPELTAFTVLPRTDAPTVDSWGMKGCEREIPAMLQAASANGGKLKARLVITMRVQRDWSDYFGCSLSNVETDTLTFDVKDHGGNQVQFSTETGQKIKQLTPEDCGVKR